MPKSYVIGVDIGGTKIATGLTDLQGNILQRVEEATEAAQGTDAVIGRIIGTIRTAMQRQGIQAADVEGIGIGCPGPIDPERGAVVAAPNLGWTDVPVATLVRDAIGAPAYLANDANAAALGEASFGAGRGVRNMAYITVSTGVGGGLIVDGKILNGSHFTAGEIGHIVMIADGPRCGCGRSGCLEAISSGTAIARMAVEAIREGRSTRIRELAGDDLSKVTAKLVGEAAQRGDAVAQEILDYAFHYLALGIINLLHLVDPEMVVIGGGVSKLGPMLFDPVRRLVREKALGSIGPRVQIVPAQLGPDAGLMGAVTLVLQERGIL